MKGKAVRQRGVGGRQGRGRGLVEARQRGVGSRRGRGGAGAGAKGVESERCPGQAKW